MLKKNLIYTAVSAGVMMILPLLASLLTGRNAGMPAALMLFFAIDPAEAAIIGALSGKRIKYCWFQPLLASVLFLAGAWLSFDMAFKDILIFSAAYLGIGYLMALITALIARRYRDEEDEK